MGNCSAYGILCSLIVGGKDHDFIGHSRRSGQQTFFYRQLTDRSEFGHHALLNNKVLQSSSDIGYMAAETGLQIGLQPGALVPAGEETAVNEHDPVLQSLHVLQELYNYNHWIFNKLDLLFAGELSRSAQVSAISLNTCSTSKP
jgi:hypothetical protein